MQWSRPSSRDEPHCNYGGAAPRVDDDDDGLDDDDDDDDGLDDGQKIRVEMSHIVIMEVLHPDDDDDDDDDDETFRSR